MTTSQRVLIVEDYTPLAAAVVRLLHGDGHDVRHVSTGRAALTVYELFFPTVVLLDLELPDIEGHEVAHLLRRQASHALRILVMTARTNAKDTALAYALGCEHVLRKPFDATALRAALG